MNQVGAVEQPESKSGEPDDVVRRWLREIDLAAKDPAMTRWRERARAISDRYRHEASREDGTRRFAMLWSNIETLKPAVYARAPKAEISRRFKDADPVGRIASEMLERASNIVIDCNDIDGTLRRVRDDFLLIARGQGWVRYKPELRQVAPSGGEPYDEVAYERVCVDYVHWDDFGHTVARTWPEVRAVWRRVFLTRDELVKRFGENAAAVSLDHAPTGTSDKGGDADPALKKATVYEIWDKVDRKVYFIPKSGQEPLAVEDPPLSFEGFFPCPRPAYGTLTNDSTAPIPDFIYWQDQAEEINDLTQRIAMLTDSLKLVGFYAAGPDGDGGAAIQKALKPETQSEMIPVDSWAAFAERGGVKGLIEWLPVDMVVKVLTGCFEVRKQLVQDVYEITGISDILRGASDASETATAQQIKANWGSLRVRDRQSELARFARDCIRLVAEVIAEVFQPQTLVAMTGIKLPTKAEQDQAKAMLAQQQAMAVQQTGGTASPPQMPPGAMGSPGAGPPPGPPMAPPQPPPAPPQVQEMLSSPTLEDVMALLRSGAAREFRIDIETDSTIQPDEDAEKQRRIEFLTAVGGFLQQAGPMVQVMPQAAPMFAEMLMFGVRGFRAGRQLEDVIERTMGQIVQAAQQPKPAGDPAAMAKAEVDKGRLELDTRKAQADVTLEQGWQALEADKLHLQERQHAVDTAVGQHRHAIDTAQGAQQHAGDLQVRRDGMAARAAAARPQPGMVQ